jgi:hypothetical protein
MKNVVATASGLAWCDSLVLNSDPIPFKMYDLGQAVRSLCGWHVAQAMSLLHVSSYLNWYKIWGEGGNLFFRYHHCFILGHSVYLERYPQYRNIWKTLQGVSCKKMWIIACIAAFEKMTWITCDKSKCRTCKGKHIKGLKERCMWYIAEEWWGKIIKRVMKEWSPRRQKAIVSGIDNYRDV